MCFESSKSGSSKRNKVIRLVDITDIQKVGGPCPLWVPGRKPWVWEGAWPVPRESLW